MLFCFSFSKMCLCVWFSKTGVANREEPKTTSWFISTVMLFLCEVANLKKNDKKLRIVLCTFMYSYFFFINSLLIYLCDIGILLKSSLGECHRHVCHVLLRILHNDILSTSICPFVFPQTSFINQYFYSIVISFVYINYLSFMV